jgi:putative MATE family efflux protein
MFTKKQLWALLIPLMVEQVLNSLMGTADTMMVSNVGSAAISAVSLVDSINTLILNIFSALATGGAIVCSQYIGKQRTDKANVAGRQLILSMFAISVVISAICVIFRAPLLSLIFGKVDADVMENALTYMLITGLSFPFIGLYNASAALFRSSGNSKLPMTVSMISNCINIVGNAIFIFGLKMGVAGAALSTLTSRIFCAVVIMYIQTKPKQTIYISNYLAIRPDLSMVKMILGFGIPTGIENGMFQFGKLAIQSTVSTLGTTAIAAQAMTAVLEGFSSMAGMGIGLGMVTVVGQCIGAGRKDEAKRYILKLTWYGEVSIIISCVLLYLACDLITTLGGMEPEAASLCKQMTLAITIYKPIAWSFSFMPGYGMRAAGDVKFSMITSSITMWICRVFLTIVLIRFFGWGPMAVWIGMFTDWTARSICFATRFFTGGWMKKKAV